MPLFSLLAARFVFVVHTQIENIYLKLVYLFFLSNFLMCFVII